MKIPEQALHLLPTFETFEINTDLRKAHFLSQVMHESGDFKRVMENLNYSVEGLLNIFPKYFDETTALGYARNPEKIANRVYANRMGNGDESSGDGWKYRGRGYIQLTGKENYQRLSQSVKVDFVETPDLLFAPKYCALSAGWFWSLKGLNLYADEGSDVAVIKAIRKKINGGLNGLEDVIKRFHKIYDVP